MRLCPDFHSTTRLIYVHVQTLVLSPDFVRSPVFRAFMSKLSCVHQTFVWSLPDVFVLLCPVIRAFNSFSCVYVQYFVRLCPHFHAISRIIWVHVQTLVFSPDFVRSPVFRAFMSKLWCLHQIFVCSFPDLLGLLCPNIRAFTNFSGDCFQTFGRSTYFPAFKSRLRAITKILRVHVQTLVLSTDFRAFTGFLCVYVQTSVRLPLFCAFMSRLSGVHQTFVRLGSDFFVCIKRLCACLLVCLFALLRSENSSGHGDFLFDLKNSFMFRLWLVHQTLREFMSRLSCVHQTFVLLCLDFRAITWILCVHVHILILSPDFCAFTSFLLVYVHTFVRSPDFRVYMSRISCVHQTFALQPVFRAFMSRQLCVYQTFVCSCPDFRAFNRYLCVYVQTFGCS